MRDVVPQIFREFSILDVLEHLMGYSKLPSDLSFLIHNSTRGRQKSWRKAAFQCTITHRTFANRRANTFQIVPWIRGHLRKQNGSQTLNVPRAIVHWKLAWCHEFWHPLVALLLSFSTPLGKGRQVHILKNVQSRTCKSFRNKVWAQMPLPRFMWFLTSTTNQIHVAK